MNKICALEFLPHLNSTPLSRPFSLPVGSCPLEKLKVQAPKLLEAAVKVVTEKEDSDAKVQSLAYISITKLSARLPSLFSEKLGLLKQFIDSLGEVHVCLVVRECTFVCARLCVCFN